jgi:rRNA maturation RNase YbeY
MASGIDIKTTLRRAPKGARRFLPFEGMAKMVLGRNYDLSLVICGDTLAQKMNRTYRKKTYAANVLSFPLSKLEGEIFLNVRAAEREARKFGTTPRARLALLFVHGLLHLKGLPHGRTMERKERQVLRAFGVF